jgi:transposase InsO family protein
MDLRHSLYTLYGSTLKRLRTDRGREYLGLENLTRFLYERGIVHEQTAAQSSASNGLAERMNRTLFDITRSLIIDCTVPIPFWGEAIRTACQIRNRLSSESINNISPHQLWFGNAPTLPRSRIEVDLLRAQGNVNLP